MYDNENSLILRISEEYINLSRVFSIEIREALSVLELAASEIAHGHSRESTIEAGETNAMASRARFRLRRLSDRAEAIALSREPLPAVSMSTFDLTQLIRDTVSIVSGFLDIRTQGSRTEFVIRAVDRSLLFTGSLRAVRGMLLHLIENALIYSPNSGSIGISVRRDRDNAEIRVLSGAPLDLDREFWSRYEQNRDSRHGSGLGLPYITSIAKRHGGMVSVVTDSDTAEFIVRLPIITNDRPPAEHAKTDEGDAVRDALVELSDLLPASLYKDKYLD